MGAAAFAPVELPVRKIGVFCSGTNSAADLPSACSFFKMSFGARKMVFHANITATRTYWPGTYSSTLHNVLSSTISLNLSITAAFISQRFKMLKSFCTKKRSPVASAGMLKHEAVWRRFPSVLICGISGKADGSGRRRMMRAHAQSPDGVTC